jgi:hypothetical protein
MPTSAVENSHTGTADWVNVVSARTNVGVYMFDFDMVNMVAGDIVEVRVSKKIQAALATSKVVEVSYVFQDEKVPQLGPFVSLHEITIAMKATTSLVVPWTLSAL